MQQVLIARGISMKVGQVFTSNAGLDCEVVKLIPPKKAIIKFKETGSCREVHTDNLIAGKVRDLYNKSCYGVGYLGDIDKTLKFYNQANQLWRNMMKRCYSHNDPKSYLGRCTVDARWHCLASFIEDIQKLENFDKWLLGGNCTKTKYQLDKDIVGDGTIYSKHTCMFITEHENKKAGAINARAWDSRYGRSRPIK